MTRKVRGTMITFEYSLSWRGDTHTFDIISDGVKVGGFELCEVEDYGLEFACFGINEEYRGQGIGSEVLAIIGMLSVPITLGCGRQRVDFYKRNGFAVVSTVGADSEFHYMQLTT